MKHLELIDLEFLKVKSKIKVKSFENNIIVIGGVFFTGEIELKKANRIIRKEVRRISTDKIKVIYE